jgi:hypothetical protein
MNRQITCEICHKKLTKGYGMHRKACERRYRDQQYALAHASESTTEEGPEEPGALEKECLATYIILTFS